MILYLPPLTPSSLLDLEILWKSQYFRQGTMAKAFPLRRWLRARYRLSNLEILTFCNQCQKISCAVYLSNYLEVFDKKNK